jgi:hypothetical protein
MKIVTTNGVTSFFQGKSERPYVNFPGTNSPVNLIMEGNFILDPRGLTNGPLWNEPGWFNGSEGIWKQILLYILSLRD